MQNNNDSLDNSAQTASSQKKVKIVFLGDQGVGKTSIIKKFIYEHFEENNTATIGVDLVSKTIPVDGKNLRLNLWDTAGQERFKCLIPGYIRDCQVAVVVYDITNKITFNNLEEWEQQIRNQREGDVIVALVGCKSDLSEKREVSTSEGSKYAEQIKAIFFEVSAKTGENIEKFFNAIVYQLVGGTATPTPQKLTEVEQTPNKVQGFNLNQREEEKQNPQKSNKGCC